MSTAATPEPSQPALSEPARLINVFFAPSKTFIDLRRKPSWWVPWLLGAVLSVAFVALVNQRIGMEQVMENYLRAQPKTADRIEKLPADQQQRVRNQMMMGFKYGSYAAPVFSLLGLLIISGVLMASFNFGAGAELKFGTSMAVVSYSFLPFVLHALLAMGTLFGIDPEAFNLENPVATNLGFLVSAGSSPGLYRLASGVDVFAIWVIILMGIGFAAVSKLKRGTTTMTVAAWYLLWVLVRAGWAAAFS